MKRHTFFLALATALPSFCQTPASPSELEANKKLLLDFFSAPIQERTKLLTPDYIQHNPRFLEMNEITHAAGADAWLSAVQAAGEHVDKLVDPDFKPPITLLLTMAEGDLVTAIFKATVQDPDDSSKTYEKFIFETVRIRDGKLAEHWDGVALAKGWKNELQLPGDK
jgi:predicted SnoaL-like aldol condensation-catalyzing enzyme